MWKGDVMNDVNRNQNLTEQKMPVEKHQCAFAPSPIEEKKI